MLVYLAGPIDLVTEGQRSAWREKFATELAARQISSFNPAAAFRFIPQNKSDAESLVEINKEAMLRTDFVVLVMGKDMPSIGTPIELYLVKQHKIPHCVIWEPSLDSFDDDSAKTSTPEPVLPAYVHGLADRVFTRFDSALDYIVQYGKLRNSVPDYYQPIVRLSPNRGNEEEEIAFVNRGND